MLNIWVGQLVIWLSLLATLWRLGTWIYKLIGFFLELNERLAHIDTKLKTLLENNGGKLWNGIERRK